MLSDPRIAPQHARLLPSGGGFVIEDLGGGTLVNGASIAGPTLLQPGDTVTVGTTSLVYQGSATPVQPMPAAVLPPAPRPPAPAAPFPPSPARVLPSQPGVLADGPVQTVDPERQDTPPFDPGRALVILSVGLTLLGVFAGVALASAMLWIVLLIVGLGGLGCIFPMLLALIASIFRPILGWLGGRQMVSIINFQMLDSLSGAPVDVMVVRKRGGGGNVRLGDKVRVWGKQQANTGLIRAHRVEIYESGGHPANQALEGDKPWPIWVGLGALGFAIFILFNACSSLGG